MCGGKLGCRLLGCSVGSLDIEMQIEMGMHETGSFQSWIRDIFQVLPHGTKRFFHGGASWSHKVPLRGLRILNRMVMLVMCPESKLAFFHDDGKSWSEAQKI